MGRARAALDVQLHQALGGETDHLAQIIGVGGLFQKRLQGHSVLGHLRTYARPLTGQIRR